MLLPDKHSILFAHASYPMALIRGIRSPGLVESEVRLNNRFGTDTLEAVNRTS